MESAKNGRPAFAAAPLRRATFAWLVNRRRVAEVDGALQ